MHDGIEFADTVSDLPLPCGERLKEALTALLLSLTLTATALAQAPDARWPDKPIRLIVPLPAGSAVDLVGRLVAQKLGARLGQPVIVENRVGASGAIGTEAIVRAPARRLHDRHGDLDHARDRPGAQSEALLRSGQ